MVDYELHHVGITTTDLDRLVGFYREHFGFEISESASWECGHDAIDELVGLRGSAARYVMLRCATGYLEIHEYSAPEAGKADPARPVSEPGLTHFCVRVNDIEVEYRRLSEAGMHFHSAPFPSIEDAAPGAARVAYGRDPDGNVVELIQLPSAV